MRPLLTATCIALIMSSTPGVSAEEREVASPTKSSVLSRVGRKRVRHNLKIMRENLKDLERNLEITEGNIRTLQTELKKLDSLEKEHLDLKKKYGSYLDFAAAELEKNRKLMEELEKWEREHSQDVSAMDENTKSRAEAVRIEKNDRERWKKDAETKVAKINELLRGVIQNLHEIHAEKLPLKDKIATWESREIQYRKIIADTTSKQTALLKIIEQQPE